MRQLVLAVTGALGGGNVVTLPFRSGLFDGTSLHAVVDSVVGVLVGAVLVALYLAALRRIDDEPATEEDRPTEPAPSRRQDDDS
jgi:NhaP-type Na+/H+ or K+/H+ antiporter